MTSLRALGDAAYVNGKTLMLVKRVGGQVKPKDERDIYLAKFAVYVLDLRNLPPLPECPA